MVWSIKCNIRPQYMKVKTTLRVDDKTIKNSRSKMNINQESSKNSRGQGHRSQKSQVLQVRT
jgi:hypothetical protein